MRILLISLGLLLFCAVGIQAQETTRFSEAYQSFKRGVDFYQKGLFGLAQKQFASSMDLTRQVNEPQYTLLHKQSELLHAQSAVRLEKSQGEKLIVDFARDHAPDPTAQQAMLEIGNYYYNQRKYDEAIDMLSRIDQYSLPRALRQEVIFKLGYCQFVKKEFNEAKRNFSQIKEIENEYYYPSNYYYGLTQFYGGNYDDAIYHFQRVRNSRKYDDYIPFYITQIYFAKGEYENLLKYAEPLANDTKLRKLTEINQLIGQAYYEIGDYEKALPYFDYFASRSNSFRPEDYYQLGFVYYQNDQFEKAVDEFEKLNQVDSKLGQNAMYNLGDAYLNLDDKASARNAFAQAARMKYDKEVQQEANFYYGKLSYELNFDREALTALLKVKPGHRNYSESQNLLSELFLKSRDYVNAISTLETMPSRTAKLDETYQKVLYLRGLQLYGEGQMDDAREYFEEALANSYSRQTDALAHYWLGEISHKERQYDLSIRHLNDYFEESRQLKDAPEEASYPVASYTQGYNYLKKKNYTSALPFFKETISILKRQSASFDNRKITNQLLGDAILRAGDCLFKQNNYNEAIGYYNEAISNQYSGFVYALYQKAIIEGLRGRQTEKLLALEEITDNYPNEAYADEALLELGTTYQNMNLLEQAKAPLRKLVTQYRGKSNLLNEGLLKLGLITYNQGDINAALTYYKEVFNNNPSPEEAQSALTSIEEIYVDDLNDPDGYIDFLATIPGYNVDSAEKEAISFQAAEAQYENANYSEAIGSFTRYLQKYPEGRYSLAAHYYRGESHAVLKEFSEALADYGYVVDRGVSNYYTRALRKAAIIAEVHEKDYAAALEYYQKMETAALTDEERFEAQLGAMENAFKAGNMQQTYDLAQKVSSNPLASEEQLGTAYFFIGKVAQERRSFTDALDALERAADLLENEKGAEARYQIAYVHYLKRDLGKAREQSLAAGKANSAYPYWMAKSLILLSDVLAEQGDLFNAQAVLEGLLENYDEDEELVAEATRKLERIKKLQQSESQLDLNEEDDLLEMEEIDNN